MKKSILRGSLIALIAIIAYTITDTLIAAGTFKSIEPHFNGTITKVPLPVAGPEDIAIDTTTGIAFIAVDDRRANHRDPGIVEGAILIMNLNDSARTIRNITPAGFTDLHPHGISLWKKDSASTLLFVVNHRQLNRSDVVERFEWRNDSLIHLESFSDSLLMTAPNDVVAVGEREFYVTNDHYYARPGAGRLLEEYLQRAISYVNYFDGSKFRTVAEGIAYANGINLSPDGEKVYVAATTGRKVYTYDRGSDGSLTLTAEQDLETGVDNIDITANGDLWIGCHPQLLKYSAHALDHSNRSPSQVIRMLPDGTAEEIFLSDGVDYSGSTVGAVWGKMILVGSVFEPSLLILTRK